MSVQTEKWGWAEIVLSYDDDIAGHIRHWSTGGRMVIHEHIDLGKVILSEKIDLSLNRSLEELVNSYFEAENVSEEDIDSSAFSALEDYLSGMDAI